VADPTTHWEGCERTHHACALAMLNALRGATASTPTSDLDALVAQYGPLTEQPVLDALRTRLAQMETDIRDAAGELRVEMPEPGTPMAKLLSANVLMRRERDGLRAALSAEQDAHDATQAKVRSLVVAVQTALATWVGSSRGDAAERLADDLRAALATRTGVGTEDRGDG